MFSWHPILPIGIAIVSLGSMLVSETIASNARPNIVLVMADDQGWGDMAYQGHPHLQTPNFDEAAKTGLRFNRFYAAAPVCSPTRASVLTGRHPNRMGVFKWGYPIRPQETTIAEILQSANYQTAHFGKWHLGSVRRNSPANPGQNGFDEWLSAPNFYDNNPILSHRGKAIPLQGESSIVAADAAIDWMEQASKSDRPFFTVIWFGSPHGPHRAIESDRKLYSKHKKNRREFYGEITGMDRAFGKIREALSKFGVRDNTILWYCSDNGALPNLGSTGGFRGHKSKVYEGGLLVPAILEWPQKIDQPFETDFRSNTSDILPTLLAATGLKTESNRPLDGISLLPVIEQKVKSRKEGMGFWDYSAKGIGTPSAKWMGELLEAQKAGGDLEPHVSSLNAGKLPADKFSNSEFPGHAAWISNNWKIHRIETGKGKINWELYNLAADDEESNNQFNQEEERVIQMKKELNSWLKSVVASLNGDDY